MSSDENFLKILEKLTEVQVEVGSVKSQVVDLKDSVREIKLDVRRNTEDLADHIQGVKTNAERLNVERDARIEQHQQTLALIESHKKDNDEQFKKVKDETLKKIEDRLEEVEFLPKMASMVRKAVLWVGAPAGAIYALGRVLGWF